MTNKEIIAKLGRLSTCTHMLYQADFLKLVARRIKKLGKLEDELKKRAGK